MLTIAAITYDKIVSKIIYSQTFDYVQFKTRGYEYIRGYESSRNNRDR